jgi:hypothetical protein
VLLIRQLYEIHAEISRGDEKLLRDCQASEALGGRAVPHVRGTQSAFPNFWKFRGFLKNGPGMKVTEKLN